MLARETIFDGVQLSDELYWNLNSDGHLPSGPYRLEISSQKNATQRIIMIN
jgi:hypothetical protein